MTKQRFQEVLKEYGVAQLTTIKPEKITEPKLRMLLSEMLSIVKNK